MMMQAQHMETKPAPCAPMPDHARMVAPLLLAVPPSGIPALSLPLSIKQEQSSGGAVEATFLAPSGKGADEALTSFTTNVNNLSNAMLNHVDAIASTKSLGEAMRLLAPQLEGLPRR
jgi:hypothetical protein